MLKIPFVSKRSELEEIELRGVSLSKRSDRELLESSLELRYRAQSGESLLELLPLAFALVREAASRTLKLRHFDVQLLGGIHMSRGRVIEMETGQGKTLTATLPLYLFALQGQGAHLATSNDYLAQRDAETMRPLFGLLGLSCGFIADEMQDMDRKKNYACDITYGTGTGFGFDFLKDRMKKRLLKNNPEQRNSCSVVQRGLHFVLADEADSLLIDDANTPLIIGANSELDEQQLELYRWVVSIAPFAIAGKHYLTGSKQREVSLTSHGRTWVREHLQRKPLRSVCSPLQVYELIEKAILVANDFHRDTQYIIREGEIVLVNESTGRLGEGRQLQDGLHQIIQAKEQLPITAPNQHAARVTVQGLFLTYRNLAGMSGTALSDASEFRRVYKMSVVRIPTARKSNRKALPTRCFVKAEDKWNAICDEAIEMQQQGRAILIGTRSVEKSERLSQLLTLRGVGHIVLNARHHAEEATIIAKAGMQGAVTVATGLAGRGTDIKLEDDVRAAGGLHVIMSELHDSKRSDQQLFGRCARQGDPGSYRQYLSLDDEILELAFGEESAQDTRRRISSSRIPAVLYAAQQFIERRCRKSRYLQLHHEKRKLRSLSEMGLDPLLDTLS